LVPIVETILLCGRLGIALRGHRDDGELSFNNAIVGMEGNFRALLAFRVQSGDVALSHHFSNASKKATYISKRIQNELIDLCGNEILEQIVKQILTCNCFVILTDETSDASHAEQLCICIRYVTSNVVIKEQFLGFANLDDLWVSSIAHEILARLASLGISIKSCVGQGYDGASVMCSGR